MCNCKLANYSGGCSCNSSFSEISSGDLELLNSNFEDNLFRESFYASDDEFAEFLGKRKKAGSTEAKPKKDIKKTLTDGADIFSKVAGIFSGKQSSKGEFETGSYEARLGANETTPVSSKKILGMPAMVFYTGAVVATILAVITILKLSKK